MRLLAEIALLVIAAIGLVVCIALLPGAASTQRRSARERARSRPEQLVNVERLVITAQANQLHTHAYLRPVLTEITSSRLAAHGYALASMPEERGRRLLGEPLWEIVRPGRPFPEDRHAPGVSRAQLGAILDVLEGL